MTILYRADGSPDLGTGHIVRGLILRRRLEAMGARVVFLSRDLSWGMQKLRDEGCQVIPLAAAAAADEAEALARAVRSASAAVCVMDVLETVVEVTGAAARSGCPVVCLDDVGPGRLHARAIVNTLEVEPEPQLLAARGIALHQGPQYMALSQAYEQPGIAEREIPQRVRRLVVTIGGADPAGLVPKAARALRLAFDDPGAASAFDRPRARLIVGSASGFRAQVAAAIAGAPEFEVVEHLPSLLPALREADLGIVAGGLTMHEALAVGLPAIALCQRVRHQAELAQRFADAGAMLTLGVGEGVSEKQIARSVLELAADRDLRRRLACRGPRLVDGHGARRTAEIILAAARAALAARG